jgi:hypothetical protein
MESDLPTIYILSGGIGASAEQLVHTVLAQFPKNSVRVITIGNVRHPQKISAVLEQAKETGALVVYTLVDPLLHDNIVTDARKKNVDAVDLMGALMDWITQKVGKPPKGQPGLYRQLNREYFDRISAIDFTMAHDDGKNPDDWSEADAVLVGVSRVGKTPLSVYLAVLGWKIANYPLVPEIPLRESLFSLDPRRVIGITLDAAQLLVHRQRRQRNLGAPGVSPYADPRSIHNELQEAMTVFRRGGFVVVDMSDKTIEMGADEIIRHLTMLRQ